MKLSPFQSINVCWIAFSNNCYYQRSVILGSYQSLSAYYLSTTADVSSASIAFLTNMCVMYSIPHLLETRTNLLEKLPTQEERDGSDEAPSNNSDMQLLIASKQTAIRLEEEKVKVAESLEKMEEVWFKQENGKQAEENRVSRWKCKLTSTKI